MELRHLRYFVAVADELNFRRAAERLNVAHPSLSKQIQNLEHELGLVLLERNTAGVRLTNAGTVYLESARQILRLSEEAVQRARDASSGRLGRLVIGDAGPLTAKLIPSLLVSFRKLQPAVEVSLHETFLPDQLDELERGTMQVAFSMLPEAELPSHLEHLLVLRSPVCLVLNRHHVLARKTSFSIGDVHGEPLICLGAHTRLPGHAERVCAAYAAQGLAVPRIRRVNSLETLSTMVVSNQGIAFLPKALVPKGAAELVVRNVRDLGPNTWFELSAVWRRKETSPLVAQFIALLRQVLAG